MKTYQQPDLLLRYVQEQDVITSSLERISTTQNDFFDVNAFENAKENNE